MGGCAGGGGGTLGIGQVEVLANDGANFTVHLTGMNGLYGGVDPDGVYMGTVCAGLD